MPKNIQPVTDTLPLDKLEKHPARSSNLPPLLVEILKPGDGATLNAGGTARLRATARVGSRDLSDKIRWRSSRDGFLGRGRVVKAELSIGEHTLSASIRRPVNTTRQATSDAKAQVTVNVSDPNNASDPTNYEDGNASDPTNYDDGNAPDPNDCGGSNASDPTNYGYGDGSAFDTNDCGDGNASDPTNYGYGDGSTSDPTDCGDGNASDPTNYGYGNGDASDSTDCGDGNASDPTNYDDGPG